MSRRISLDPKILPMSLETDPPIVVIYVVAGGCGGNGGGGGVAGLRNFFESRLVCGLGSRSLYLIRRYVVGCETSGRNDSRKVSCLGDYLVL